MNNYDVKTINKLLTENSSMLVGRNAEMALRDARTIFAFEQMEADDLVRLTTEDEQESYFGVYGKPDSEKERKSIIDLIDRWGCVCCIAEYKDEDGEWQQADSIGMCIYENPLSPYENCYVTGLMRAAIDAVNAWRNPSIEQLAKIAQPVEHEFCQTETLCD